VSFKFRDVDKHFVCLFVCFICCFVGFCLYINLFLFVAMVLIGQYIVIVDCMSLVCLTCLNIAYH
jgi:hypothetical protein